ncbi:nuclear transport factor 2 family protein [Microbulbifer hainanensis]|uniref:nuclear transport factor 2 family protein n=1 Tax=Microbulbifer hainanensis TaxID=2735675 RepID=UPI0018693D96|nr:nuclear transport factor 2 family protein [Microbulbifer hainanensis]
MKTCIALLSALIFSVSAHSFANEQDLTKFGEEYFKAYTQTQRPDATEQDIENYLSFLTDDVGSQHFPNDMDDTRKPGNKAKMRKGMNYYRGGSSSYKAKLESITTGKDVIVLKFKQSFEGFHKQLKKQVAFASEVVEVLEVENDKVSVIRIYAKSL